MKIKEEASNSTEQSVKPVKKNGIAKKKKKSGNFEVRIPRIIVRNLGFKVSDNF
jgi:predicted HicB family RNase H-like nuclease